MHTKALVAHPASQSASRASNHSSVPDLGGLGSFTTAIARSSRRVTFGPVEVPAASRVDRHNGSSARCKSFKHHTDG